MKVSVFNSGGYPPPWWGLNLFWHGTERASYECCWCRATSMMNVNECCWCRSICLVNDPYVIRVICFRHPSSVIKASTEHHSSKHSSMTPALFRHHSSYRGVRISYPQIKTFKHDSSIIQASFKLSGGTNFVPQIKTFKHDSSIIQASFRHHRSYRGVRISYPQMETFKHESSIIQASIQHHWGII